jgi:haloacetate dehalogenase
MRRVRIIYRAEASIDLVYDDADFGVNKVTCPLFALWSETGYVGRHYNPIEIWRDYATDVDGLSLPCGHYLPEEMPDETYTALRGFLLGNPC